MQLYKMQVLYIQKGEQNRENAKTGYFLGFEVILGVSVVSEDRTHCEA